MKQTLSSLTIDFEIASWYFILPLLNELSLIISDPLSPLYKLSLSVKHFAYVTS